MNISELYFNDVECLLKWYRENEPDSYQQYMRIKEEIKIASFSRSTLLLKNLNSGSNVVNFLSHLTEMNLSYVLLKKSVKNLAYEPKEVPGVDFTFDDIAISVKNLNPKDYEKNEQQRIEKLKKKGGGSEIFTHKDFSRTALKVKKTAEDIFVWERTETANSKGFLDSDLYQMSAPLSYIGEFENINAGPRKKVLFFYIQSEEFPHYYIADIVAWYFNDSSYTEPIFRDKEYYYKLFKKNEKNNSIDGLVFMYAPSGLSWPDGSMCEVREGRARLVICSKEKSFFEELKSLLRN